MTQFNYVIPKELSSLDLQKFVSLMIRYGKKVNKTVRFISYLYEKNGEVWFVGFQAVPNELVQKVYWKKQIVTDEHSIVVDLTKGLNTIEFSAGFKCIQNPQRFMFNNSSLVTNALN